jgi:hypothetical protein
MQAEIKTTLEKEKKIIVDLCQGKPLRQKAIKIAVLTNK